MRLQINQASVSLGGETILDHCSFEIRGKEKIGIVGVNGSGKTTLLRLLAGELDTDRDDKQFQSGIWMARNTTIGFLQQNPFMDRESEYTVDEYMNSICPVDDIYSVERYQFETEYHKIYTTLGFSLDEKKKKLKEFSGGEQTKLALIRLLLSKPDIMLLDEPTNHLDLSMIEWLEGYIRSYEKAIVIVSHDRFFLDCVTDVIYEISHGKTKRYSGNYSAYRKQREEEIQIQRKRYLEQKEEMDRLNQVIERFKHKPTKASMARSKKKALERMPKIDPPDESASYLYPGEILPQRQSSKWIYDCQKLKIGYDHPLYELNLRVRRGQKIGIIGKNGSGKSTFLKTLAGLQAPISGKVFEGTNVEMSYYDQFTAAIESEDRLLDHFQKIYPGYSYEDCRKVLARFLFRKEDVSKTIKMLSGGEKSRYTFAGMLEGKPNVLLLDEPTNHLDIPSKEVLESAFSQYRGSILFVTHDRYCLKQLADSLLIFEDDQVTYYPHDYAHYLESKRKTLENSRKGIHGVEEENLLLQQSFEAVPQKTRMQAARFNTEQSYSDWQLELASKEMVSQNRIYEMLQSDFPTDHLGLFDVYYEEYGFNQTDYERKKAELQKCEENWTESLLVWYEKWLEYEDAFENYRDE